MKRNASKSNIVHLIILLILLFSCHQRSYSQTFPNINNDTTQLRRITEEEGASQSSLLFMDTIGIHNFHLGILSEAIYYNRYYSKVGVKFIFNSYYLENVENNIPCDSIITSNLELKELFNNLKLQFGNYYLKNKYQSGISKGKEFSIIFDNFINLTQAKEFLKNNGSAFFYNVSVTNYPQKVPESSIESIKKISNLIVPNPVSDILKLDIKNENMTNFQYEILDINGNKVLEGTLINSQNIYVSNLSKGTYIIKFNSQSQKFIKE